MLLGFGLILRDAIEIFHFENMEIPRKEEMNKQTNCSGDVTIRKISLKERLIKNRKDFIMLFILQILWMTQHVNQHH